MTTPEPAPAARGRAGRRERQDRPRLAALEVRVGGFRPNVVVRSRPTSGALPALGAQSVAGASGHHAIGRITSGEMKVQATHSGHVWRTMTREIGLALQLH
ncbi:hypothetical protein ACQ7DA_04410 [Zafaria sp. J156]|uniref:hypothetical protein n=1 Tax=Zafaria sp. J156 TaxID=3116490 RepID=UPI002E7A485F|nr:hypothetical protein [Zafaria sp. J156]MEE1620468.1 hypothetical protein [Zafaria sp. J156]